MKHPLTDPMISEITGIFGALGDGSRLRILRVLLETQQPLSQGAVADAAGLSQANASKHLACRRSPRRPTALPSAAACRVRAAARAPGAAGRVAAPTPRRRAAAAGFPLCPWRVGGRRRRRPSPADGGGRRSGRSPAGRPGLADCGGGGPIPGVPSGRRYHARRS